MKIKKVLLAYFDYPWFQVLGVILPSVGYTIVVIKRFGLGSNENAINIRRLADYAGGFWLLMLLGFLGIFVAMVRHLMQRQWPNARASLRLFCVLFLTTFLPIFILMPPMGVFRIQTGGERKSEKNVIAPDGGETKEKQGAESGDANRLWHFRKPEGCHA